LGRPLLGERNWWLPGWLDRLLPQLSLDSGSAIAAAPVRSTDDDQALAA